MRRSSGGGCRHDARGGRRVAHRGCVRGGSECGGEEQCRWPGAWRRGLLRGRPPGAMRVKARRGDSKRGRQHAGGREWAGWLSWLRAARGRRRAAGGAGRAARVPFGAAASGARGGRTSAGCSLPAGCCLGCALLRAAAAGVPGGGPPLGVGAAGTGGTQSALLVGFFKHSSGSSTSRLHALAVCCHRRLAGGVTAPHHRSAGSSFLSCSIVIPDTPNPSAVLWRVACLAAATPRQSMPE